MKKLVYLLLVISLILGTNFSIASADSDDSTTSSTSSSSDDSDDSSEDEDEDESDDSGNDSESDLDDSDEDSSDNEDEDVRENEDEQFCYGEWRDPEDCAKKAAKNKGWMSQVKEKFSSQWDEVKKEKKPNWNNSGMNKYRDAFAQKLGDRLSKISAEKLNLIVGKIDAMITKISADDTMDDLRQEKMLAQLEALKSLVQDALDEKENTIDIDALLE